MHTMAHLQDKKEQEVKVEFLNTDDIKKTDTWQLFEKGRDYLRRMNVYTDTDINYRMYNGNQWEGANIEGIEKAQYNFIETIVNYKVSTINQNLWQIHFSSENFEQKEFRKNAKKVCDLLDKKASRVWEKDQMDSKIRGISDDSAINDEGVMSLALLLQAGKVQFLGQMEPREFEVSLLQEDVPEVELFLAVAAGQL